MDQGIKKALSGLKVKDLMSTPVMVLGAHTRLQDAIESHFLKRPYGSYPVVDGARVVGILDRAQVRAVSPEQWRVLEAIDVMQPIDGAERLTPDQSAADAMTRFDNVGASRLPVMQNNELVGYLSLNDIARQVMWLDRSARVQKN
jgi:predicted transcriptional regulator